MWFPAGRIGRRAFLRAIAEEMPADPASHQLIAAAILTDIAAEFDPVRARLREPGSGADRARRPLLSAGRTRQAVAVKRNGTDDDEALDDELPDIADAGQNEAVRQNREDDCTDERAPD